MNLQKKKQMVLVALQGETDGLTMKALCAKTGLSYSQVYPATVALRSNHQVTVEPRGVAYTLHLA